MDLKTKPTLSRLEYPMGKKGSGREEQFAGMVLVVRISASSIQGNAKNWKQQ